MAHIRIDENFCKGCGLCTYACPKHMRALAKDRMNEKNVYFINPSFDD